jgi:catechol O-methyltransferase
MADDPFSCFDNESDDENAHADDVGETLRVRDLDCGVLAFHNGTERALVLFVQQQCEAASTFTSQAVRLAVDTFCIQRHWMMHVGPEKSRQLESSLKNCVNKRPSTDSKFVLLELGTYCGYSSIMWAETLQQLGLDFHVYTVEANPEFIEMSKELIRLAGLQSVISVLHLDIVGKNQTITDLLSENAVCNLNFVFLDHDKHAYLDDLQELEKAKLIRAGVHVVADNVLFARIDSYRRYMKNLAERGIVQTRLEVGCLEYSEMEQNAATDPSVYQDGIGRLAPFLPHGSENCICLPIIAQLSYFLFGIQSSQFMSRIRCS